MKNLKILLCISVMLLFFAGCEDNKNTVEVNLPGIVQSPEKDVEKEDNRNKKQTFEVQENVVYEAVPEHWQSLDADENLWYVPNEEIEAYGCTILTKKDSYIYFYREKDEVLLFSKANVETGELIDQVELKGRQGWNVVFRLQELENGFAFCDCVAGIVKILDWNLQVVEEYQIEATKGEWYIGLQGDILFGFVGNELVATNLITGEKQIMLEDMYWEKLGQNKEAIFFSYISKENQEKTCVKLNLQIGQLEQVPFEEECWELEGNENVWLGQMIGVAPEGGSIYLIYDQNEDLKVFVEPEDLDVSFIEEKKHILLVRGGGDSLQLYDECGKWISSCEFPTYYRLANYDMKNGCIFWSENYGGYFLKIGNGAQRKLVFWKVTQQDKQSDEKDLKLISMNEWTKLPGGDAVEPELYRWSQNLSEQYDLDIRIADQCEISYYKYEIIEEPLEIMEDLIQLQMVLSKYDKEFLKNLHYSSFHNIEILLVKNLREEGWEGIGDKRYYRYELDYKILQDFGKMTIIIDTSAMEEGSYEEIFSELDERRMKWQEHYWYDYFRK